jgi:hypothetical protein
MSIARPLAERIYGHIGAERDAFYITDPAGKAIAGGGLCVTAPDTLSVGARRSQVRRSSPWVTIPIAESPLQPNGATESCRSQLKSSEPR